MTYPNYRNNPLPRKRRGEAKSDFIGRCMKWMYHEEEVPDRWPHKQGQAICYSQSRAPARRNPECTDTGEKIMPGENQCPGCYLEGQEGACPTWEHYLENPDVPNCTVCGQWYVELVQHDCDPYAPKTLSYRLTDENWNEAEALRSKLNYGFDSGAGGGIRDWQFEMLDAENREEIVDAFETLNIPFTTT